MGPQRQFEHIIKRPPFYHPPRSRPVTFEDPIIAARTGADALKSIFDENSLSRPLQDRSLDQNYQSTMSNTLFGRRQQYVNQQNNNNSDVYNSLPRPYQRNGQQNDCYNIHYYQQQAANLYSKSGDDGNQHQRVATMPKILVNDRSTSPYPTSTVHKSMLNTCRSPVNYNVDNSYSSSNNFAREKNQNGNQAINYSRLISPTIIRRTPLSPQVANQEGNYERTISSSHGGGASNYQQVAQALPMSTRDNPIEFIAAPYYQQQLKSPGCSSSRSEEAREFLHRVLPSSSSSLSSMIASGPTAARRLGTDAGVGAIAGAGSMPVSQSCLKMANQKAAQFDSNLVVPDTKRDEYMWNKQLEQVSIAHQTYRTLPIVQPKPKARHDLPSGNYMCLNQDPTWNIIRSRSSSRASRDHDRKIELAIKSNGISSSYTQDGQEATSLRSRPIYVADDSCVPVFKYHDYIESTRRAH